MLPSHIQIHLGAELGAELIIAVALALVIFWITRGAHLSSRSFWS